MDNATRRTLDELDVFLDRTFQGRAADSTAVDPGLAECARRLYASDAAPAADPLFLRKLREDLMLTPTPAITGSSTAYQPSIVAPPRIARPRLLPATGKTAVRTLNHWRRRTWPAIEFLGAAMLILGLLAGAFSLNNGPATLTQNEASGTAMLGGNPARTGEMPGPGPEGQPGLLWKSQVGIARELAPGSSPIVVDGMVYVVASGLTGYADQFFLVAMDAATGRNIWEVGLDGSAYAAPAVANGLVYLGITTHHVIRGGVVGTPDPIKTDLGFLVAFDAKAGQEEWRQETRGSESSSPAVSDDMVLIGATDGGMYAFDAESGDPRWQSDAAIWNDEFLDRNYRELAAPASSTPALGDGLVVVTSSLGTVHALDIETGEERWTTALPPGALGMPVISEGLVLVGIENVDPYRGRDAATPSTSRDTDAAAMLVALDSSTGAIAWNNLMWPAEYISAVAVTGDHIYALGSNASESILRSLRPSDGRDVWRQAWKGGNFGSPTVANGTVLAGGGDGYIYAFDAETGLERWNVRIGGTVASSIVAEGGLLYIHSGTERSIYALGATAPGDGTPAATPPADGDVSGIPPCTIEPRAEPESRLRGDGTPIALPPATPSATPEASVVAVTDLQRTGQPAAMLPGDVPGGSAASDDQIAEITAALKAMMNCNRPGNERQVAAFYSDDFFNRPWVAASVGWNGYQYLWANEAEAVAFKETHVLNDGRVAVVIRYNDIYARLVIFTEQDGRWLIDELVEVTDHPDQRG